MNRHRRKFTYYEAPGPLAPMADQVHLKSPAVATALRMTPEVRRRLTYRRARLAHLTRYLDVRHRCHRETFMNPLAHQAEPCPHGCHPATCGSCQRPTDATILAAWAPGLVWDDVRCGGCQRPLTGLDECPDGCDAEPEAS